MIVADRSAGQSFGQIRFVKQRIDGAIRDEPLGLPHKGVDFTIQKTQFIQNHFNTNTMPEHPKHADPAFPIHDLIAERWSPYAFDPKPVEVEKLRSCLEAARWAASSYNEQPWSFLVAGREDTAAFEKMLGCLAEPNREWAQNVGVLLLTVYKKTFSKNGKPNRVAEHDIGLAAGNLSLQATALGLAVHQMAGVNLSVVRQTYNIPDTHEPTTAIAIGYAAEKIEDESLAESETRPRSRKPQEEFVFSDTWGNAAEL